MGLALIGYSKVIDLGEENELDDSSEITGTYEKPIIYISPNTPFFEQWLGSIKPKHNYKVTGDSHRYDSSYTSYGNFKNLLALFTTNRTYFEMCDDLTAFKDTPFYEIFDFGDNEGFIGPEVSAELNTDFKQWRDGFKKFIKEDFYLLEKYDDLLHVYEKGADNGIVSFR